ncbi:MAG: hypothetical protein Q4E88_00970 [Coriobacteriia bacterium]|nr:hypothetical protein [Coriobacteriia bacterium]
MKNIKKKIKDELQIKIEEVENPHPRRILICMHLLLMQLALLQGLILINLNKKN